MKKRLFVTLLALVLLVLCGCKAAPDSNEGAVNTNPTDEIVGSMGVEDSIFDNGEDDDKSFSASVDVVPQDPTETATPDETEPATEDVTTPTTEDQTEPTVNDETEPTVNDETEPSTGNTTEPTAGGGNNTPDTSMTYEEFEALSATQKREFQESFSDIALFFDWYEAAKAKYEEENPPIIIDGNGNIVLP